MNGLDVRSIQQLTNRVDRQETTLRAAVSDYPCSEATLTRYVRHCRLRVGRFACLPPEPEVTLPDPVEPSEPISAPEPQSEAEARPYSPTELSLFLPDSDEHPIRNPAVRVSEAEWMDYDEFYDSHGRPRLFNLDQRDLDQWDDMSEVMQ